MCPDCSGAGDVVADGWDETVPMAAAIRAYKAAEGAVPVAWECWGERPGEWKEARHIIYDSVEANRRSLDKWWHVRPLYAAPQPSQSRDEVVEACIRAAEGCDIFVPLTPGAADGASLASRSIVTALRALSASPQREGWRDISTAPKDGTDILLYSAIGDRSKDGATIGHWTTEEECRVDIGDCGGACHCREYDYVDPSWMSWDGGFTEEHPPTHWMPLPTPPKEG